MDSDARNPTTKRVEYIAGSLAGAFVVALPLLLILRNEPLTPSAFFAFRLILSVCAGVIGAIIPGFLEFRTARVNVLRASSGLALFIITYFFTPSILSEFNAPQWIGTTSAIFGILGFLASIMTSVIAMSTHHWIKDKRIEIVMREYEGMELILKKGTLTRDEIEQIKTSLTNIQAANTSIQQSFGGSGTDTKSKSK